MSGAPNRRTMSVRLVWRALLVRRRRMGFALLALLVGATLAGALLTTYADLEKKMAGELRGFGANLVVVPAGNGSGATLALPRLTAALDAAGLSESPAAPFLYVLGRVHGEAAVLAGAEFDRLAPFTRAWQWRGRAPHAAQRDSAPVECAAGERLAARFALQPGSVVNVAYGRQEVPLRVSGIVSTGGSEDSQLLLPLDVLQSLAQLAGRASMVQLIAGGAGTPPAGARDRLAAALGSAVEVRVLRQVAESSARVLLKIKWILFAVTALVLGIVGLGVMTTLSAIVLERRKDIAVMKALGGHPARITSLFLAESAVLSLSAGLGGYLAGTLLARALGGAVFHAPVAIRLAVLPQVVLVTVLVALLATLFPLRLIRAVEPAAILKGE